MNTVFQIFSICVFLSIHAFYPCHSQNIVTLVIQPGAETGCDAYINSVSSMANVPYGNYQSFMACAYTYGGEYGTGRSLMKFDLTSIPANVTIISATLDLYNDYNNPWYNQNGDNACYLQRITSAWAEESVTWNTQPAYTQLHQVYLPASVSNTQDYTGIDVTTLVKDMVINTNWGFALNIINENPYASLIFASGDNITEVIRPRLTVKYTECSFPTNYTYSTENLTCSFHDTTSVSISWFWDFGDGYFSNLRNPIHVFSSEGLYSVFLIVGNSCGTDTICNEVSLCKASVPDFGYYNTNDRLVEFNDSSLNAASWFWNFGDGFYSDMQNPLHYFNNYGTYEVCLITANACITDTVCKIVQVQPNGIKALQEWNIRIFPNPSDKDFTIEFPEKSGIYHISAVDVSGKVVYTAVKPEDESVVILPALKAGVYTLFMNNATFARTYKIVSIKR
ncbi:MAG: DNRLRE domain-containing protein [Bacteroidota bacterium]